MKDNIVAFYNKLGFPTPTFNSADEIIYALMDKKSDEDIKYLRPPYGLYKNSFISKCYSKLFIEGSKELIVLYSLLIPTRYVFILITILIIV